jgi:hypothetical protein
MRFNLPTLVVTLALILPATAGATGFKTVYSSPSGGLYPEVGAIAGRRST